MALTEACDNRRFGLAALQHVHGGDRKPAALRPPGGTAPGGARWPGMKRILAAMALILPAPLLAAPSAQQIDSATYDGGTLPDGQSALTARVQALLDRAGISPGVIDGYKGGMSESAIRAFEAREGFDVDGVLDGEVWSALGGAAVTRSYTVTDEDAAGLVDAIPDSPAGKAEMDALAHLRLTERLAERFHMDEDFLIALNEGTEIAPGARIDVIDPGADVEGTVARIEVDKPSQRLLAYDADGVMLANYPVAIGSSSTPSPSGTHEITAVAVDPTYSYRPDVNGVVDGVEEALTLPAGANNPVGVVWLDLSEPTFGIHGTPEPAKLFERGSIGCVRMTNWDVTELAFLVSAGVEVEFVE